MNVKQTTKTASTTTTTTEKVWVVVYGTGGFIIVLYFVSPEGQYRILHCSPRRVVKQPSASHVCARGFYHQPGLAEAARETRDQSYFGFTNLVRALFLIGSPRFISRFLVYLCHVPPFYRPFLFPLSVVFIDQPRLPSLLAWWSGCSWWLRPSFWVLCSRLAV